MPEHTLLRRVAAALTLFALVLAMPDARGQEQTERFIPIGESPGLSGKVTAIGAIQSMQGRILTLTSEGGARKFEVTDRTRIWIDRSRQKLGNLSGALGDLQAGRRAEVRPDVRNAAAADWVKVEAAGN